MDGRGGGVREGKGEGRERGIDKALMDATYL